MYCMTSRTASATKPQDNQTGSFYSLPASNLTRHSILLTVRYVVFVLFSIALNANFTRHNELGDNSPIFPFFVCPAVWATHNGGGGTR